MLYFIANETARTRKGMIVWKKVQTELKERNIAYKAFKGVKIVDCKQIKIELEKPMALHTDGEYIADVTEVTYTCIPSKLGFII